MTTGGDNFSNISNSTIISRSAIEGAVNTLTQSGNVDQANAMKQLGEMVKESGNEEAGELYEALAQEVQKPEPKKSLMQRYWDGIKTILPLVANAAAITGVIDKLVGS
jgi:hypothetical protein